MSESKVEQELLSIANLKTKKNEKRQEYLKRLMLAVDKASDDDWNSLSTEAQAWNNTAATSYQNEKLIPDFPDYQEEEPEPEEEPQEVIDQETGEVIEVAPDEVKVEASEPTEEAETKAEAPAERKTRKTKRSGSKPSACRMIKQLVLINPKITVGEIAERLKTLRMKVSDVTIYTLRYDIRDTLRAMNDLGIGPGFDV